MGFGKSETPQDREYKIRDHVDNLEGLIDHLAMHDITIVGQDWGGPIGEAYALRHPERVKRMVLMNTGTPAPPPEGTKTIQEHDWYQWIHGDTDTDAVLSNLSSTILSVMKRIGFERTGHVDETWVRAYASPFPTAADCKGARTFPCASATPRPPRRCSSTSPTSPRWPPSRPCTSTARRTGPSPPSSASGRSAASGPTRRSSPCPASATSSRRTRPKR